MYGTIFLLGIILSGNEVSQILLSLVLSYYGGTRNRPKWIAFGTLSSALSCFVLALPHLLYGPGEDAIRLTRQYIDATGAVSLAEFLNADFLINSFSRTYHLYHNMVNMKTQFYIAMPINPHKIVMQIA